MLEMFVSRVALDIERGTAVVLLADEAETRLLPIWIGVFEAKAIATELHGEKPERPMTHDLLAAILEQTGFVMESVTITDLRESTFYALIRLTRGDDTLDVDARPSDSLALALRCHARIFVDEDVLAQVEIRPGEQGLEDDVERFERLMSQVDLPSDSGEGPLPFEPSDEEDQE
jgi:uncharacterized protein